MKHIARFYIHQVPGKEQEVYYSDLSEYSWAGALLGIREVEVEIEPFDIDPVVAMIDCLEAQIEKERADSQMRVNLMLERIGKLKCLEHKE